MTPAEHEDTTKIFGYICKVIQSKIKSNAKLCNQGISFLGNKFQFCSVEIKNCTGPACIYFDLHEFTITTSTDRCFIQASDPSCFTKIAQEIDRIYRR